MSYSSTLRDAEFKQRVRSLLWTYDAGRTKRFHAHPDYGQTPLQSVAEHTWGVVLVLLFLCDMEGRSPSTALLRAAMRHDAHERITGDVPANAKWDYPPLREALQHAEARIEESDRWKRLFRTADRRELSERDRTLLKWADSLELLIYANRCIQHGALAYREIAHNIHQFLANAAPECEVGSRLLGFIDNDMGVLI